ncbi:hypothetical protein D3C81_1167340 [compost metagenome]
MIVLEAHVQPESNKFCAFIDAQVVFRTPLPDVFKLVSQLDPGFPFVVDRVLDQLFVMLFDLLIRQSLCPVIVCVEEVNVHVLDVVHHLIDPGIQVRVELLELLFQPINVCLRTATGTL